MNPLESCAALLALTFASPSAAQDHWVASWGAGSVKLAGITVPAAGTTYRNIAHLSLGGKQVRITLSNRFGSTPLSVGGASIARSVGGGMIDAATLRHITFGGKPGTVIAPGAVLISDPVAIDVPPLGDLAVSLYLPAQTTSFLTGHPVSHQTNYHGDGNQLGAATLSNVMSDKPWRVLTAIDVLAPAQDTAIVAFGDSITDGTGSTDDTNRRWPNQLAARLQADPRYARFAVVDEGIGGNRILHAGGEPDARAGQHQSAVDRWGYDALDRSGVKYIVLLEGVNDIGRSSVIREGSGGPRQDKDQEQPVTADDLMKAMTTLIDRAHAKGIKVIGATLTPFGGAKYWRADGQAAHEAVNAFIRHGGKFDGVIDFEKATQDPASPQQYRAAFNERDHLHPNDAGAAAMAASVDLGLFK